MPDGRRYFTCRATSRSVVGVELIEYSWRGQFSNSELNHLHAAAFGHRIYDDAEWDWVQLCGSHSLGWVTARADGRLVGFVNVISDGLVHAWLQDQMVDPEARRRGIGKALIRTAQDAAKKAGCEWLHVDFDDHLRPFYYGALGFRPTNGGLIDLSGGE